MPAAGITLEAAPTAHGLAMEIQFHGQGPRRLIIDTAQAGAARGDFATSMQVNPERGEVLLTTASGSDMHADFRLHVVLRISGARVNFGQYAHSNQPSHATLPFLAHCGATGLWRDTVQRVLTELYRPQPDGFPGDEDNGEMSAWWLCAALGLFPDCPASDRWLRVRPLLRNWRLRRPAGSELSLETTASSRGNQDDCWRRADGLEAQQQHLDHATVVAGGAWRITDR